MGVRWFDLIGELYVGELGRANDQLLFVGRLRIPRGKVVKVLLDHHVAGTGCRPRRGAKRVSLSAVWFNRGMPDAEELETVYDFLCRFRALPNKQRHFAASELPLAEMHLAATCHPDPWVRRSCLYFLDHYANDESTSTFLAALDDPVTPVREMALHGLACERCRSAELCVDDVVPVLSRIVDADASPDIRHKVVPILMGLSGRDARARTALERVACSDQDPLVREVAVAALEGRYRDALRSRHDLLRRAKTRRGKTVRSLHG
jgi:hypothetical protein